MKTFVSGRPYWWQWFTILSLDAPLVAVVWQALAAKVAEVAVRPVHLFILGASVWCAYAADRWIEGWRLPLDRVMTQRHFFAVRWRWPLLIAWCVVVSADLLAAFTLLHSYELVAGALLLCPVLVYLFSHQFLHRHRAWRLPKEICVAGLLCGGVLIFVVSQPTAHIQALSEFATGFLLLCFANCALISYWEHEVDQTQGQDSLASSLSRSWVRAFPWALSSGALGLLFVETQTWRQRTVIALAISAALLGGVDLFENRIGRQLARVLADAVLLSPLLLLSWPAA